MDTEKFILRPAQWTDLAAVTDLIRDVLTADNDADSALSLQEVENEWKTEGFKLETDAWVVTEAGGRVVGYEEFVHRHAHAYFNADGYVHPEYRGHGIGTALLHMVDERALHEMKHAEPDLRVYIRVGTNGSDLLVREMFEDEGYRAIRYHWMMETNLTEVPKLKPLPDGIELRPFDAEGHAYPVFQANEEAFQDHWGHVPGNFNNWKLRRMEYEDFDPTLWKIAWEGDQIAGFSQNRFRNGFGWVNTLGVRRPWRKRGLGEALLLHSFNEFYKRGVMKINLGVDASNPTGATRLYQKVGMNIAVEDVIFEKELRPGRELDEQE
ncbi:MAG TPA: GNAT family N-acetyltransferase [Anaerolineales bacterium]